VLGLDGSKPMSLEILFYLVPGSRKKSISRDENARCRNTSRVALCVMGKQQFK
jgi:hypothetical protein